MLALTEHELFQQYPFLQDLVIQAKDALLLMVEVGKEIDHYIRQVLEECTQSTNGVVSSAQSQFNAMLPTPMKLQTVQGIEAMKTMMNLLFKSEKQGDKSTESFSDLFKLTGLMLFLCFLLWVKARRVQARQGRQ